MRGEVNNSNYKIQIRNYFFDVRLSIGARSEVIYTYLLESALH